MIYISHPFGGLKENVLKVEKIIESLVEEYPDETFVSPIHCFGFMYDTVDYDKGLDMCLELLSKCDKMLVFGDWCTSTGCMTEITYANIRNIPYEMIG